MINSPSSPTDRPDDQPEYYTLRDLADRWRVEDPSPDGSTEAQQVAFCDSCDEVAVVTEVLVDGVRMLLCSDCR